MAKKKTANRPTKTESTLPDPKHLFMAKRSSGIQSSLTDSLLQWGEKELGVKLPSSYVALLRKRNGGYLRFGGFLVDKPLPKEHTHRKMYEIDRIAGLHRKHSDSITYSANLASQEWDVPDGLCAFDGDGHWWACLDYRKCGVKGEPSITHYDTESEIECAIASSFGEFVSGLVFGEDDYLFALDDPDLDRAELHEVMKAIGCRKQRLSGMSAAERAKISSWDFPKYRWSHGGKDPAYLVVEANGDDDPWHLARPAGHPLLHVSVAEKDQDKCIGDIAEALGDRGCLIHQPFDRKPIKGIKVTDKKPVAPKRSSKNSVSSKLIERPKPDKKYQMADAIENNDTKAVRDLLDSGVDPNGKTKYGLHSFLVQASQSGKTAIVKILLEYADKLAKDRGLKSAVGSCKPSIAKLLLEAGVKPGQSDLFFSIDNRNRSNVILLLEHGVTPTPHCVRSAAGIKDLDQYGVKNRTIDKPILRALRKAWTKPVNAEMRTLFDKI